MIIIAGKSFEDFIRRTRNEPGCLDFYISADPIEDNRVNNFELWASQEQLDEYRERAEPPAPVTEEWGEENVKKYQISTAGQDFREQNFPTKQHNKTRNPIAYSSIRCVSGGG